MEWGIEIEMWSRHAYAEHEDKHESCGFRIRFHFSPEGNKIILLLLIHNSWIFDQILELEKTRKQYSTVFLRNSLETINYSFVEVHKVKINSSAFLLSLLTCLCQVGSMILMQI